MRPRDRDGASQGEKSGPGDVIRFSVRRVQERGRVKLVLVC